MVPAPSTDASTPSAEDDSTLASDPLPASTVSWAVPTFPRLARTIDALYAGSKLLAVIFVLTVAAIAAWGGIAGGGAAIAFVVGYRLLLAMLVIGVPIAVAAGAKRGRLLRDIGLSDLLRAGLPIGSASEAVVATVSAIGVGAVVIAAAQHPVGWVLVMAGISLVFVSLSSGRGGTARIDPSDREYYREYDEPDRLGESARSFTLSGLRTVRVVTIGSVALISLSGGQAGLSGPGLLIAPADKRAEIVETLEAIAAAEADSANSRWLRGVGVALIMGSIGLPIVAFALGASGDLVAILGVLATFGVLLGLVIAVY